jgi:hypothetical protein
MTQTNISEIGKLVAIISQIKTPSFVRILNYTNDKAGEVSNYTINLGVKYENAKQSDAEFLLDTENIKNVDFGSEVVKAASVEAWNEMLESRLAPTAKTQAQSDGQSDAYVTLCPNVRLHIAEQRIFIYGFVVKKDVLVEGIYKSVNSSAKTLAKRKIEKHLKATQFRQFAFDKLQSVKVKGEEIEITIG